MGSEWKAATQTAARAAHKADISGSGLLLCELGHEPINLQGRSAGSSDQIPQRREMS